MKQEGILRFVIEKGERRYEFLAPLGAPFGETHDAVYEVVQEILTMAKNRAESLKNTEETVEEK